jgi:hypothetical protein
LFDEADVPGDLAEEQIRRRRLAAVVQSRFRVLCQCPEAKVVGDFVQLQVVCPVMFPDAGPVLGCCLWVGFEFGFDGFLQFSGVDERVGVV